MTTENLSPVVSRARLIRLARALSAQFTLRPIRTVFDDTGMHVHFGTVVRRSKLTFMFQGSWSLLATRAIEAAFPGDTVLSEEARPSKVALIPYMHGTVTSPEHGVLTWGIDPGTFTLTVRQRIMRNPWVAGLDALPKLNLSDKPQGQKTPDVRSSAENLLVSADTKDLQAPVKHLSFRSDIPNATWLAEKKEYNNYKNKNEFGVPRSVGPITGSFGRYVLLPLSLLVKVPGARGEQSNIREDSLLYLLKYMGESLHLPIENGNQYPPFVLVDQEGHPWLMEGNHRVMAAAKLGWEFLPVEVRYFTGGELHTNGLFAPEKLKAWDAKARAKKFRPDNKFHAKPGV